MGTIKRGIKNITRNKFRNIAIILVLTLSLSLALMMINMDFSSNHKIRSIKRYLGNKFDVYMSHEYFEKLYEERKGVISEEEKIRLLDENIAEEILKINTVKSVIKNMRGTFTSKKLRSLFPEMEETHEEESKNTIVTAVEEIPSESSELGEYKLGGQFFLYGIDEANMIPDFQDGYYGLAEGNLFSKTDIEQNVALIEKKFAEINNLKIGSDIIINGERINVCGIYEGKSYEIKVGITGTSFEMGGSDTIYVPFKTAQRLLDKEGKIDHLTVIVDSIDDVKKTMDYINNKIGNGKITAVQFTGKYYPTVYSLNKIKNITKIAMISTFIVGVLIILLIMFINVRERAKEIGILKAIGASNFNISTQFLTESLTLCFAALILSVIIILIANQFLADLIIEKTSDSPEMVSEMKKVGMEEEKIYEIEELTGQLYSLKIIFSPQILIFAILLTFLLGAIGSLLPAYYISKLRPAEVLRFG